MCIEQRCYNLILSQCSDSQHHLKAFLNKVSHGELILSSDFQFSGIHGHCQVSTHRSGWGIMAKCRPSWEHTAAIPWGLPFGLSGYTVVTSPLSSTYFSGDNFLEIVSSNVSCDLNVIRPAINFDILERAGKVALNHKLLIAATSLAKLYKPLWAGKGAL